MNIPRVFLPLLSNIH